MTKLARILSLFCALFGISACGGFPVLHDYKDHDLSAMGQPDAGVARIVFIRPQTGMAGQGVVGVYDDNELIGGLSGNGYFVYDAEPGEHLFGCYAHQPAMDFMKADIAGGLTYYVQCSYQDRVVSLAAHIFAIKKGSARMGDIDNVLAPLRYSVFTAEGADMFAVKDGPDGKEIVDTRAGMFEYRIKIVELRDEWLEKSELSQKAKLLTTDGTS